MKLPLFSSLLLLSALPLFAAISDLDKKFNIKRNNPAAAPAKKASTKTAVKSNQQRSNGNKKSTAPAEPQYIVLDTGYNNEQVKLPAWYWTRTRELHEQLKAKLSPADYGEILKGEYYLFNGGEYWLGKYECQDISKDPSPVIKKLEAILADQSDDVFPRCRFVEDRREGIFFRENVLRSRQEVEWADERCINTHTKGLTEGYSMLHNFWDSRTLEKVASITMPIYTRIVGQKGNVYLIDSPPSEMYGSMWFDNSYGGKGKFLVDPFSKLFQTRYEKYGDMDFNMDLYCKADKDLNKGELYEDVKQILPLKTDYETAEKRKNAGNFAGSLPELNLSIVSEDVDNNVYMQIPEQRSGAVSFYQIDKVRFSIDFNRLTAQNNVAIQNKERIQEAPKELGVEGELRGAHESESTGEWRAFHAFQARHGEASTPDYVAVTGICNQKGNVYLFPLDCGGVIFPAKSTDWLYKFSKERDSKWLSAQYQDEKRPMPFINDFGGYMDLLQVREISSNELEIIMGGEMVPSRDCVQRVRVNLSTMQYQTFGKWEFPHKTLVPGWLPSKEWLFKPESDNQYSIIHAPAAGMEQKLADLYLFENNGYVIVLPNGHFAGSPGCEKVLGYAVGENSIGMDALAPWRNRPAEVLSVLGGEANDIAALRETTRRWLSRHGYDMDNMPEEPSVEAFPEVDVQLPDLHQKQKSMKVTVTVHAKEAEIKQLVVRADGQLIPLEKPVSVSAHQTETLSVNIPLAVGTNWIEFTAIDVNGLAGATQRFRVVHESNFTSDLYVITIGVSEYENEDLKLQYAAKDAKDVAAAFQNQRCKVRTLTLTDAEFRDATALEKIRGFLASTTIDDRVVMYCAGHGMLDEKLNYYYAPAAFDPENIAGTGIAMETLTECLSKAPARKKLLLLDTCHAGTVGEEDEEKLAMAGITLPHGVRAIAQRGMKVKNVQNALNASQTKRYIEEIFSNDDSTRGLNIISASAGSEYALESDEWNNGVFATAIIKSLTDGKIKSSSSYFSANDMAVYIVDEVQRLTGGTQCPKINSDEYAQYFKVADKTPADIVRGDLHSDGSKYTVSNEDIEFILRKYLNPDTPEDVARYLHFPLVSSDQIIASRDEYDADNAQYRAKWKKMDYRWENCSISALPDGSYEAKLQFFCELVSLKGKVIRLRCVNTMKLRDFPGEGLRIYEIKEQIIDRNAGLPAQSGANVVSTPSVSASVHDRAGLDPLIARMQALRCKHADSALYQKRLLTLLPMIRNGADVNITLPETKGNTALHYSCAIGSLSITKWLLEHGANPNAVTDKGATPLMCVGSDNGTAIRKLLIQHGARSTGSPSTSCSPTTSDRSGLDPLIARMQALRCKHADSALYQKRLLTLLPMIRNGADVNITLPETKGNTALHYSCAIGSLSITKWLLEHGANPNAVTDKGATPLQCVGSDNGTAIRKLLKQHGAIR